MGEHHAESMSIRCLSEVAWKDDGRMRLDVKESGGLQTDQYEVRWTEENAAGVLNLLTAVDGGGRERNILVDVGWDNRYVEEVLEREGVDRMLREGKIDLVYITHEHVDHFFALQSVCSLNPEVSLAVPYGISQRGLSRIAESGHRGSLVQLEPGKKHELFPGIFSVTFEVPIFLKIMNEQVLYVDLDGKGVVTMTGCCHPGIVELIRRGKEEFAGRKIYAVYGGLHICPFGDWTKEHDSLVEELSTYDVGFYACNHCTGSITVEKMREAGMKVLSGTGRFASKTKNYVGCGDLVQF